MLKQGCRSPAQTLHAACFTLSAKADSTRLAGKPVNLSTEKKKQVHGYAPSPIPSILTRLPFGFSCTINRATGS